MQRDQFDANMTRAWREHTHSLRSLFKESSPRTGAVHQRLLDLQHTISSASGERVDYRWGPAEYNLREVTVTVPYRLACEAINEDLALTVEYKRDGTHFGGRRYALEDLDGLLAALTLVIWENFSPPDFRKQPIYAPPADQ